MACDSNLEYKSIYTVQAAEMIDDGIDEKAPMDRENMKYKHENFVPAENGNPAFSTVDPVLDQATFVRRIAEMSVLDDFIDRLGDSSGVDGAAHSITPGLGLFIDLDDLLEDSGISGKSKFGVTNQHLSKIWRIDDDTASQTIEITSQHLKQEATDKMPRNFGTNDWML